MYRYKRDYNNRIGMVQYVCIYIYILYLYNNIVFSSFNATRRRRY